MKGMKNKVKFLRIVFPMALFGASYIGYIIYTITRGEPIGRKHVPSPLMNLILVGIMCISLWLAYDLYKENEGE